MWRLRNWKWTAFFILILKLLFFCGGWEGGREREFLLNQPPIFQRKHSNHFGSSHISWLGLLRPQIIDVITDVKNTVEHNKLYTHRHESYICTHSWVCIYSHLCLYEYVRINLSPHVHIYLCACAVVKETCPCLQVKERPERSCFRRVSFVSWEDGQQCLPVVPSVFTGPVKCFD